MGFRKGRLLLGLACAAVAQEPSFDELKKAFDYDRSAPANAKLGNCAARDNGVRVCEYSYNSPGGGRVPATLVLANGRGKHPLILYGHWMMKGSAFASRIEFLEEAVVMAQAGAVALLIDTPLVRPGFVEDADWRNGQGAQAGAQMVKDWRRGIDLMLARGAIDSKRIAYVGHSFSAGVGAKLIGIEKRIGTFVLMANLYSTRELAFDPDNPEMLSMRKKFGDDSLETYMRRFPWDDSVHFIRRSAPAAVFLQFGRKDAPIREPIAKASFAHFQEPKSIEFYDAGHELNAKARTDRALWLRDRLGLKALNEKALAAVPAVR